MADPRPLVLLDACCAINILATGAADEILASLPFRFAVCEYVLQHEVLYIRATKETMDPGPEDRPEDHAPPAASDLVDPVNLAPLADAGLLEILIPESSNEVETLVE